MAKRKYSKIAKSEPAELSLLFQLPAGASTNYIDLAQCMSIVNRRFYRQGINVAVSDFKVFSGAGVQGPVSISRIPHTWVAANAWKKAFESWNKQQKQALLESGAENARAKFSDFKVYLDVTHVTGTNLLPVDSFGVAAAPGEWEYSQIVIPNSGAPGVNDERYLHMVGANFNNPDSRGVIEGYADSRSYPQSPDPVDPGLDSNSNWLAKMFDVGDNQGDVIDNATDKNDELPYPQVNYPGGQTQLANPAYHDIAQLTATTIGGVTNMRGGQFFCGLIRVDSNFTVPEGQTVFIQVNLVPGSHRGYLCEPMGDV